ncbi:MAG: hypothetical protein HOC28_02795 [Bacteroidetes Order II. Incertae sedis bacterium]|jgi:uncharacterized membrane protein YdjX (TVP38/TMEM64 family)|nr:hypothetical protein [Bacteroidetes Order II. bacterium]MBT4052018.1 hypothetical protein [Bacteroidetes Order II. bacterium]MBT4602042.1 hypothetical protein [Bacteroidetes Order II. bacterium]MBT5249834.1 hypothetical protein [Bacteroidetes Order II. bacterium]MBT6199253.1 hypothetical protein [Bacteroidetes Order II. bacterium]
MTKFGSPFQNGSLSSLLMGIMMVGVIMYFYLASSERSPVFLILVIMATLSTIGTYFKYKQQSRQQKK